MELSNVIIGTKLNEIQKKPDDVRLVFEDTKANKMYVLAFKGLLFETSSPTLNKRVKNIQVNKTLGYRVISQLRHLNRIPQNYRQLFIQMEGSNEDYKLELLGALRNYKVSPLKQKTINSKPRIKKALVKKSAAKKK